MTHSLSYTVLAVPSKSANCLLLSFGRVTWLRCKNPVGLKAPHLTDFACWQSTYIPILVAAFINSKLIQSHLRAFRGFFWVLISFVSSQAWLKRAEDQRSVILLNVKEAQKAQDKLVIHQVSSPTMLGDSAAVLVRTGSRFRQQKYNWL